MDDTLHQYREQIDRLDRELVVLFEQRMRIAQQIAEYKQKKGLPVYQQDRELQVIQNAKKNASSSSFLPEIESFMLSILQLSKRVQQQNND